MQAISDEDIAMSAMQSAHQASIVARASSELIKCKDLAEFITCAHKTLNDLGYSGFARFQFNKESRHIKFGSRLRLQRRPLAGGSKNVEGAKNPGSTDGLHSPHYTYNSKYMLLIVDIECCSPIDGDIIKDNVGIFADSLNAWLESNERLYCERAKLISEKIAMVNNLNNFTQCLHQISEQLLETQRHAREDLLMQLISVFPVMELQADQEIKIINIVNASIEREGLLLSDQVKHNIKLRNLIESAVNTLLPEEVLPASESIDVQREMFVN